MKLNAVLTFLGLEPSSSDCDLNHLQIDSRLVGPGDLFLAMPGGKYDGRNFIDEAKANGAAAILVESPTLALRSRLADLAAFFYGNPSRNLKIIAITGTNGKTSCSHYIAQILSANNLSCGIMGTLGNGILDNLNNTSLTTSDCCTVQRQLADFVKQGIKCVAMEVTSIALMQDRVKNLSFDTAIFTNLTQDHLDYHGTMQEYFAAKARLFTDLCPTNSIINLDDPYAAQLLPLIPASSRIITYSLNNSLADFCLSNYKINTSLIGKFNMANVLACFAACSASGLNEGQILASIAKLKPVPGRMQLVANEHNLPKVIVDYAHTPDALLKALQAISEYNPEKLFCIFGCGGDRDRSKRPLMLKAALQYSDKVIVTSDNPRTEDPCKIIDDILSDQNNDSKITIEADRAKAINQTILQAQAGDFVLIAGKGHEDYQIIGTEKIPFSDALIAKQALKSRS